jgi:hypothetical protein
VAAVAAGTHASSENDGNRDAEVKTTAATTLSYAEQRKVNIARNEAVMAKLITSHDLLAIPKDDNKRRRHARSSDSDSDYSPNDPPKAYNLRCRQTKVRSAVSESVGAAASEAEDQEEEAKEEEEAKVMPVEKTIDFCVVFGEKDDGEAEVWFAVATEEEEEDEDKLEDGDRSVRWLEQDVDGVWRTIMSTTQVGAEYVFTTKRVTLRLSAGEVYELKSEDVPTEQEKAKYDSALKTKFAAPATLPARPSARPSTPRGGASSCEKKWKDVAVWQQAPGSELYTFTLKAAECQEKKHFLMACETATASETAAEASSRENQRSFLVVGKVKTVNREDQTFTYTLFSAVTPANAYEPSCVDGGWICATHAAQKEPAKHSDVFMYFSRLTSSRRLPAAAKERARTMCPFLN